MPDPKRTLARAVRAVYESNRDVVEQRKREARQIWAHPDFIWEQLLRSFSTMGNSRGKRLMERPELHGRVTYAAIARLSPEARRTRLRKVLSAAPVRMADRKAGWLCRNFRRIERDGGPCKVKAALCGCRGRDAKIAFLLTFDGIGPKYARNILMDAYHREFRNSIAYDERLKKIANALGLEFSRYEDAERFFLDVAETTGLDGWELDRLLYNASEDVLAHIRASARLGNLKVKQQSSGRRTAWRCK
jgi:hypothetical protein